MYVVRVVLYHCYVGGFGSDYGAGRGGGPVKAAGFTGRASAPYAGSYQICYCSNQN